jgi:uncharacterized lipoprotein YmbA
VKSLLTAACILSLLSACATSRPDHFYILSAQPQGASETRTTPATQVTLRVTLPSLVDRSEMILDTSADGVIVLEHERWAAPLADLVSQTLAQDLERRRNDILVADQSVHRASPAAINVTVDVVQMTVRRGDRASVETHWRIFDPRTGLDTVGGEVFSAPLRQDGYAAVAQALSECLGLLADRLVPQMR